MDPERDETIAVLIVDDHEFVRRGLLAFLDSEPDIEVVGEAEGGAEASSCSPRWSPRGGGCRT